MNEDPTLTDPGLDAPPSAPTRSLSAGDELGHFRVVRVLGRGGMGTVYEAQDVRLGRTVALKTVHPHLAKWSSVEQHLLDEARVMARLDDPRVVPVYEVGREGECSYLVMKYVPGTDLARWWLDHPVSEPGALVRLVDDVTAALTVVHDAGLVHGDIKPANILLDGHGRATLTDLGLASRLRDLGAHEKAGTPLYVPPERVAPERFTERPHPRGAQDLYAFSVVLFKLLTGTRPFSAMNASELLRMHVDRPPPAPSSIVPTITERVDDVILRGLAKAPWDRWASAAEMASAYRAAARPRPRVWIVDDDAAQAEAIAAMLSRRRDLDVTVFFHALSVVEAARTEVPDVLVLDVNMPELDGVELTAAMRNRAGPDDLAIVAVTGEATPAEWRRLRELGADACLLKPVVGDQLAAELDRLSRVDTTPDPALEPSAA